MDARLILLPIVFLALAGCAQGSQQPAFKIQIPDSDVSVTSEEDIRAIVDRLNQAPTWADARPGSARSRRLMDAVKFVTAHDIGQIRIALNRYVATEYTGTDTCSSRIFILNRYLFAVPETEDARNRWGFGIWDVAPIVDDTWSPLWPLAWNADRTDLAIVAGPPIQIDGEYLARAEFDFLRKKYGLRKFPGGIGQGTTTQQAK